MSRKKEERKEGTEASSRKRGREAEARKQAGKEGRKNEKNIYAVITAPREDRGG